MAFIDCGTHFHFSTTSLEVTGDQLAVRDSDPALGSVFENFSRIAR
jgi:hypothetical protein